MKTNLLNKILVVIGIIIALTLVSNNLYAASISIAAGSTSLTVGSSTTLTIRGNDVIGKISITSSNPGVISLDSSGGWLEGSMTVRAYAKSAGSAYITVTSVDTASASTGEAVSVSTGVNLSSKAVVVDTRSSNNLLSSLSIEGYELSPAFNANTNNYTMKVKSDVNEIKVSAIPADNKASTVVNGNLDLVAGDNNVTVTVTAENGYKRVYTIVINKEKNPNDINAKLKNLTIKNAVLKNEFAPDTKEYMCDDITADVTKLDIELETEIADLKYEITGNDELKKGINHIKIVVTSRDGSAKEEYEIIVFKTDEVLALKNVEEELQKDVATEPTLMDNIRTYKKQLIIAGSVLLAIVLIIVIIVIIKKVKGNNNNEYEDTVEETVTRIRKGNTLNNEEYKENTDKTTENLETTQNLENIEEAIKLDISSLTQKNAEKDDKK